MNTRRFRISSLAILWSSLVAGCLLFFFSSRGVHEIHSTMRLVEAQALDLVPSTTDWPCWRGTDYSNIVTSANVLLNGLNSENLLWRTPVPGRGHSSPCIWNDQIFLTTSDVKQQTISLLSYHQITGKLVWQTDLHCGGLMDIHQKNSHASASPACDGRHVYIATEINNAIWVSAVDLSGHISWQASAGPYVSEWGYGSSPTIYKSLIIVAGDNRGQAIDRLVGTSWLTALDRQSGEIVWRIKRTEGDSFGSPIVGTVADRDQLLLAGKESVNSYDPATGQLLWKCRWGINRTANTMVFDKEHVYASGRHPLREIVCIRADGIGDVTDTHVAWREKKSACDVPSPCVCDNSFYSLGDDGVLTCLNTADGKTVWKKRLGGNFSSSPLIAGRNIMCCNEEGQTFVVDLDHRGEIVTESTLDDGIMASPVISGHRIYLRTLTSLFCMSAQSAIPVVEKPVMSEPRL